MARKVIGIAEKVSEHWSRRWGVLLSLVLAVVTGLLVQKVLAVHDLAFELDGNIAANTLGIPLPAPPHDGTDWSAFFNTAGATNAILPGGFTHADLTRDFFTNTNGSFNTGDDTTFATGSKDTLAISTGWQCNHDSNVNSKIDIMNVYATDYQAGPGGDKYIYFGMERNANTGDANVGFWFLQDDVNCETATTTQSFSGNHKDGDILIVSAFTNGGSVSTIDVYKWVGDSPGALNPAPVAHGVDCRDPGNVGGPTDTACAAANTARLDDIPWLTAAKTLGVDHSLPTAQFFEGGLNLTATGLADKCFNTFIGVTRSSQSLTATLFDFAKGVLGECGSTTVTTPSIAWSGSPATIGSLTIETDGVMDVTDSALVTISGATTFTGDVTFHLCGPFALNATTLCDTGGVAAGTKQVTTSPQTVVSNTMHITEVGRYCWRADFAETTVPAAGITPSHDSSETECFLINPRTPTLATQAGTGPVGLGTAVEDSATLGNTANQEGSDGPAGSEDGSINPTVAGAKAGGSITFTLYKKLAVAVGGTFCGAQATGTGTNPQTVSPVDGDATYGPVSFTPDAPGTYSWVASYSGDSPNTNTASDNLNCTLANEDVVVNQVPTAIKTRQSWIPNDTATITADSGNLVAGGKATFTLYPGGSCSGIPVYGPVDVAVPGGNPSAEVSTSNATPIETLYPDAAALKGPYSWEVVYAPAAADTAHEGRKSSCETFSITYTNSDGPGTKFP